MTACRAAQSLLLPLLLLPMSVTAQDTQRPQEYPLRIPDTLAKRNSLTLLFDRNLNTNNWVVRTAIDTALGPLSLSLRQQFLANIIQVDPSPSSPSRKLEGDQNNLFFKLGTPLTRSLALRSEWSTLIYSDNKSVGLNNASFHSLLGGLDVGAVRFLTLTPLAGYRWDTQAGIPDRGPTVAFLAQMHDFTLDGYAIQGEGQYRTDFLDPRRLEDHFLTAGVQKLFSMETQDSVRIGASRIRRDFYELADSTIESRTDDVLGASNLLAYEFSRAVTSALFVNLMGRTINKDIRGQPGITPSRQQFGTRIEEFRLDTYLQASYRSPDGSTSVDARFTYNERSETHAAKLPGDPTPGIIALWNERNRQEKTKDNTTRRTSVSAIATIPLSSSDLLLAAGQASLLRYDTPSAANLEDRDEQLLAVTLSTRHGVSHLLELGITLDASVSHLVYLLQERSANNNRNRILRLAPRATYLLPGILTSTNAFEVLANYTVYDYEQSVAFARSFSYRQFSWIDSTTVDLTHRIGLDFFAYLKLYERGQLNWDEFTERTENSFVDKTFDLQIRFSPLPGTLFAAGARYFSQSRYGFETGEKRQVSMVRSVGPTCRIHWTVGPHSTLSFRGWYETQRRQDGTERAYPSMTLNLLLQF